MLYTLLVLCKIRATVARAAPHNNGCGSLKTMALRHTRFTAAGRLAEAEPAFSSDDLMAVMDAFGGEVAAAVHGPHGGGQREQCGASGGDGADLRLVS